MACFAGTEFQLATDSSLSLQEQREMLATGSSLPSQEPLPSFDCEVGSAPDYDHTSSNRPGLRKKCFAFVAVLCVLLVVVWAGSLEERDVDVLRKLLFANIFSRFSRATTTITTTPTPSLAVFWEKTFPPHMSIHMTHTTPNLIFAFCSLAMVLFLAPHKGAELNITDTERTTSKQRLHTIDSLRFFVIAYIVSGHYIDFATKDEVTLRLLKQVNVVVGFFFVISGYVAALTTTEFGERKYIAKRLDDTIKFAVLRIMGFFPLHVVVLVFFGPLFLWTDIKFNGPYVALWNGIISFTLTQAWFPRSAEVWNAQGWFLSAFAFCLFVLPHGLKLLTAMPKTQLRRTIAFLTFVNIVPKVAYSYDLNAWEIFEGTLNSRTHPHYVFFNTLRFSPLFALFEVFMGAAACRLVMLDSTKETADSGSPVIPLVAMVSIVALRAYDVIALNDMLVRGFLFIPLVISFLTRLHRQSVAPQGCNLVPTFLSLRLFKSLGGLSFLMFIVHGPIGQVFYEEAIADKLWGAPLHMICGEWSFAVYWVVVIVASYLCQKCFVESVRVKKISDLLSEAIESSICGRAQRSPRS